MKLILNILWFVLGGWISGSLWILAGCLLAVSIIGLPWAPSAFRIAGYTYWPFGRRLVDREPAGSAPGLILNVVWFILVGWWLALHHIALACGLAVTIIGLPFAWAHLKLAICSLAPVHRMVVES